MDWKLEAMNQELMSMTMELALLSEKEMEEPERELLNQEIPALMLVIGMVLFQLHWKLHLEEIDPNIQCLPLVRIFVPHGATPGWQTQVLMSMPARRWKVSDEGFPWWKSFVDVQRYILANNNGEKVVCIVIGDQKQHLKK